MIVRVQSPDGTKRIECKPDETLVAFFDKIKNVFELSSVFSFSLYRERNKSKPLPYLERKILSQYKVSHGDMLYLEYKEPVNKDKNILSTLEASSSALNNSHRNIFSANFSSSIAEDEVDKFLFKQDGYIQRQRDEKLCHHGPHAKCVHCAPVEPYNEDYLREHNIKHMSFHSYLRKLTGGVDKGKFAALENISCKVKPGCKEHAPWPHGICTKCQPNAITLNRQRYRHVDNVMFENPSLVERFLDYWRCTGHQRMGFLYGRYEPHKDVPLGIKAIVAAIYEPPQEGSTNMLKLLPDDKAELVNEIAKQLGLKKIGWIFTDLIAEDLQKGTVKHLRNAKSYFLSAQECIMAGHFQNQNPNPCRLSPDGYFGSKFVTVCVTGDKDNHVHMEGYQVSNQCMALVRDSCLVPTKDAPELGYVRESSNEQYVPDVFFKEKDSYGNEVTQLSRPLPIEYLLVDVPVSTPVDPQYTFSATPGIKQFPVENRLIDGHIQDFNALATYMHQFPPDRFLEALSDYHVLLYIATMDMLPLKDALEPLLEAVRNRNKELAMHWARSEQWATVEQLIAAQAASPQLPQRELGPSAAAAAASATSVSSSNSLWTCRHCTFLNQQVNVMCEICGLPQ